MMRLPYIYDDGGRADAGYRGNAGDCVCRAIAIATGRDYTEIYEALADGNASQRQGKYTRRADGVRTARAGISVKRQWFKDYMTQLGFVWTPTMTVGSGCRVHLRAGELPTGRLVVAVSKHYVAVIDGVIHDTYNPDRRGDRCVYGYYKYRGIVV